jgi:DNA mismatch endonuclease (patch repair protein)
MPKTNREYWRRKFAENEQRDAINRTKLKELGWKVVEIWECQLRRSSDAAIQRLKTTIART